MKWIPVLRDFILFLTGLGLIVRSVLERTPDPVLMEVGAALAGIPGLIHGSSLARRDTGSAPQSSPDSLSSEQAGSPSGE
jgi:hypothetical protein